ncbi:carbohydrate binding [Homalodisca vitripennis]|nr:carbohydrate binding [Homalodisca vitripennis]
MLPGREADLFTGVLFNTYSAPSGFCFDILCSDEPIIDDKHSPDYNADKRAAEFERLIFRQMESYKSKKNLAITMGGDFTYQDAHYHLVNIDRLIR